MRVGILGTGNVGQTLAAGFAAKGHDVMMGTRNPNATKSRGKPEGWGPPAMTEFMAKHPKIKLGTFADAARHGEVAVMAVEGRHAMDVARAIGSGLDGKTVLDTTNPLAPGKDGVHRAATSSGSVLQDLQAALPKARFVKAFNCVPGMVMVNPTLPGGPGTQFICGDDAKAKTQAAGLLKEFGWPSIDIGGAAMAPYVEGMAIAVINHGMRAGRWDWGLKLLQA